MCNNAVLCAHLKDIIVWRVVNFIYKINELAHFHLKLYH